MKTKTLIFILFVAIGLHSTAQSPAVKAKPLSDQMADKVMDLWKERSKKWLDDDGVILDGMNEVWRRTGNATYFKYVQQQVDPFISDGGTTAGTVLLTLYKVTGQQKYFDAATILWNQLKEHPGTKENGFWLKKQPFYAEYAALINNKEAYGDIANQFISMEKDAKMSSYAMELVDVLDYFPKDHPKRKELINILNRVVVAGPSTSAMSVYSIVKGIRLQYLPASSFVVAEQAYKEMQNEFVKQSDFSKDPKGIGVFIKAANEMEIAAMPKPGQGKMVMLDSYFNNEMKKDQSGNEVSWHYKWGEMGNSGFGIWGEQFNNTGFKTSTLYAAPTAANLKNASVYIIVDPDTEKETPKPNFVNANDIKNITNWVKAGGVLLLMGNDLGNAEFDHFNQLAKQFGITFNKDSKGRVVKNEYEMGKALVPAGNEVFKTAKQLYIKEYSTLILQSPATALLKDKEGDNMIAVAKLGKGTVFAIGDPWLYDEYVDGRKLPVEYDNFNAGQDLVSWISRQLKK